MHRSRLAAVTIEFDAQSLEEAARYREQG